MIKTVITCDRCGLAMAQVDARGPWAEDRVVALAEKCGNTIDGEDICRKCKGIIDAERCDDGTGPLGEEEITKKIVVPSEYRRRVQSDGGPDKS